MFSIMILARSSVLLSVGALVLYDIGSGCTRVSRRMMRRVIQEGLMHI